MSNTLAHLDAFQTAIASEPMCSRDRADLNHKINRLRSDTLGALHNGLRASGRVDPGDSERARQAAVQGDARSFLPARRVFGEVEERRVFMDAFRL